MTPLETYLSKENKLLTEKCTRLLQELGRLEAKSETATKQPTLSIIRGGRYTELQRKGGAQ